MSQYHKKEILMEQEWSKPKSLRIKSFKQAADEEIEYIEKRKNGEIKPLKTSLKKFNKALMAGVSKGDIITIAGGSGSGKTSLLNQLESDFFECNPHEKIAVLNFNFEMQSRRLIGRKLSRVLKKTVKQIYSADDDTFNNISDSELDKSKAYIEQNKDRPVHYVDISGNVNEIEETIMEFNQMYPDRWIIVTLDHSGLVKKLGNKNNVDHMYDVMFMFNRVKKLIDASFILVSQLNRNIESQDRKLNPQLHYPNRSDIWGSDSVFIYSDLVAVMHRPETLGLIQYGPDKLPVTNKVYMHYIKCRDGEQFIASMENDLRNNQIIETI